MELFRKYVNQTRKPEGFLGKMMLKGMNAGHPSKPWITVIAHKSAIDSHRFQCYNPVVSRL